MGRERINHSQTTESILYAQIKWGLNHRYLTEWTGLQWQTPLSPGHSERSHCQNMELTPWGHRNNFLLASHNPLVNSPIWTKEKNAASYWKTKKTLVTVVFLCFQPWSCQHVPDNRLCRDAGVLCGTNSFHRWSSSWSLLAEPVQRFWMDCRDLSHLLFYIHFYIYFGDPLTFVLDAPECSLIEWNILKFVFPVFHRRWSH